MSTEITQAHEWRRRCLAGPRACLIAEPDVVVDSFGHCMTCGFQPFSHEPVAMSSLPRRSNGSVTA